jgi:hypothetical protein
MIQTKFVEKTKTQDYVQCLSQKTVPFLDNVEKYGTARQATDKNIIRRMRFASWITMATHTQSEYLILIALHIPCLPS